MRGVSAHGGQGAGSLVLHEGKRKKGKRILSEKYRRLGPLPRGANRGRREGDQEMTSAEMAHVLRYLDESMQLLMDKVDRMEETLAKQAELLEESKKKTAAKKTNGARLVMGRMAARAGMTLEEWNAHCLRTGHNPMQMDRSIENHSKGSLSATPSPAREKFLAEYGRKKARKDGV